MKADRKKKQTASATERFFDEIDSIVTQTTSLSGVAGTTLEEFLCQNILVKGPFGQLVPFSFEGYAFWKWITRVSQNHPYLVFLKAAQVIFSTWMLGRLTWKGAGTSLKAGLYFPDDTSMKDFHDDRVVPFLQNCKVLHQYLKENQTDNNRTKKLGDFTLALRGTWTKRGVKTIDLDAVGLDEVDEHDEENIEFVPDRLLASKLGWMMLGSQPSLPNVGIHAEFSNSTQGFWLIRCGCGEWNNLIERWLSDHDSIWGFKDKDSKIQPVPGSVFYACAGCGKPIDNQKGEYVNKIQKHDHHGFQLSQLWTPNDPSQLYKRQLNANTSAKRKAFCISVIGWPYSSDEEQPLQKEDIERWQSDFVLQDGCQYFTFHGLDQGDTIHGVFGEPTTDGRIKIIGLYKGHVINEIDYYNSIQRFNVYSGVIDAMPNRNFSMKTALKFPDNIRIQFFSKKFSEREEILPGSESVGVIQVNRDVSLQETVDAIKAGLFLFPDPKRLPPADLALYEEFKFHLTMLIRERGEDENGKALWGFKKKVPNHFGMALNSLRLAFETQSESGGSYGGGIG
ncbi:phage terminase large subunit family protein [Leptospira sp. 201903074]|uniref:phage terminase large subunit family protein n=1 Tax=Leptospira abararensis TaxID=2810036 RepID=UPI001964C965|nr:phage terminase large subunit family protein [Leptospira abararensis]